MIKTIIALIFYFSWLGSMSANEKNNADIKVNNILIVVKKNMAINPEKSIQFLEEALKYEKQINKETLFDLYRTTGVAYFKMQSYHLALDYFYKSLELQSHSDESMNYFIYNNIGSAYFALGDTAQANKFWLLSLDRLKTAIKEGNINRENFESSIVYNNLAILERQKGNYFKALEMLTEYKNYSLRFKDTLSLIRAYQNLSNVYFQINELDSSSRFIQLGTSLAISINSFTDLASLYYNRGFQFIDLNSDSALCYLMKAYELSSKYKFSQVELVSSESLADLYEKKQNYAEANKYLHLAKRLSEETINIESKKKINSLEFEHEQKIKQQKLLNRTQHRESIFVISTIFFILVSMLVLLLYRLQKNKTKSRNLENKLLIQQLEEKRKELTSNKIQIIQTSEIIESTQQSLQKLRENSDGVTNKVLLHLIENLKMDNYSFNKKEFEKLFLETDKEFYEKLLTKFPKLTNNEIRHCIFAKMNLSTKEISSLTQQSQNSILVARSRLRKKIGLSEDQNLTSFLNGLG